MSGSIYDRFGWSGAGGSPLVSQNRLLPAAPLAQPQGPGAPDNLLADAWEKNAAELKAARQRAYNQQVANGTADPETGWPNEAGWKQAADAWAGALVGGSGRMRSVPNVNGLMGSSALASRSARINPSPGAAPRPFSADYPGAVPADAGGRLLADMEGRPLSAPLVVGRQMEGAADVPADLGQMNAAVEGVTRRPAVSVPSKEIGGNAGLYRHNGPEKGVYLSRSLREGEVPQVLGHELGHAIDETAGQIPTAGLSAELKGLYNTGNNPQSHGKLWGPAQSGYKGEDVPRELMADAVRTYLTDPNYIKSVAPNTAAAIRRAVNGHPVLSRHIQFNTAPLLAGGGAAAAAGLENQGDEQ